MKYILDASFALSFLLPDEQLPDVIEMFEKYKGNKIIFAAPYLLSLEVANGLKYAVEVKRISENIAMDIFDTFLDLEINQTEINLKKTLKIALANGLSIYDASYVYLAKKLDAPLLTIDKKLKKL